MKTLKENLSVVLLCALTMYVMYISNDIADKSQKEIEKYKIELDSIQNIKDSISDELLYTQIELGRHKVAYEIFLERNPNGAHEYGTIISQETE